MRTHDDGHVAPDRESDQIQSATLINLHQMSHSQMEIAFRRLQRQADRTDGRYRRINTNYVDLKRQLRISQENERIRANEIARLTARLELVTAQRKRCLDALHANERERFRQRRLIAMMNLEINVLHNHCLIGAWIRTLRWIGDRFKKSNSSNPDPMQPIENSV